MKLSYLLTIVVLTMTLTLLSPAGFAQVPAQPPQITVTGSAAVKIAPDEIHLSVGVETREETLDFAKRQNDERVAKALAFIKRNGVDDKDVQTDFISVEPSYRDSVSRTKPTHYEVRKSIEIRFTKIQGFEGFVTGLLTNGVTTINGTDFRTTELRKHRDTARSMAIRAAREKADALATELGVRRGAPYNITANDWSEWSGGYGGRWGSRGGGAYQNTVQNVGGPADVTESTLSVGQISVTASVTVSFLIQ